MPNRMAKFPGSGVPALSPGGFSVVPWSIRRQLFQCAGGHDRQCAAMSGGEFDLRCATFIVSLHEASGAQAPAVTGFQAGKTPFGSGRRQVVADIFGKGQKLRRHDCADRVAAPIFGAGIAVSVAKVPGQRVAGTRDECLAQHVDGRILFHEAMLRANRSGRKWCCRAAAKSRETLRLTGS